MTGTERGASDVASDRGVDRGQTTLDFAVGMSLFAAVVLFVFLFVPGILAPFTVGAQDETVTTNRVADGLTQNALGSPGRPNDLEVHCTLIFFENARKGQSADACGFEGTNLTSFVGVGPRQQLNVTFVGNVSSADAGSDPLCWSRSNEALVERDDSGDCDLPLVAGDRPMRTNDDAVTASRVATLDGTDVTVRVEMW